MFKPSIIKLLKFLWGITFFQKSMLPYNEKKCYTYCDTQASPKEQREKEKTPKTERMERDLGAGGEHV